MMQRLAKSRRPPQLGDSQDFFRNTAACQLQENKTITLAANNSAPVTSQPKYGPNLIGSDRRRSKAQSGQNEKACAISSVVTSTTPTAKARAGAMPPSDRTRMPRAMPGSGEGKNIAARILYLPGGKQPE
jgi:hypothetical protein